MKEQVKKQVKATPKQTKIILASAVGAVVIVGVVIACILLTKHFAQNSHQDVDWDSYISHEVSLSKSLDIKQAGVYHLTGELKDGLVTIEADDNVKLILDNVKITNSQGPAILVKDAKSVTIEIMGVNYLEDATTYTGYEADEVGVIFSHDDLTLEGDGTLEVVAKAEDGIVSKDDLEILSGTYKIQAADDGLRGKDAVTISGGNFEIVAGGDGIKSTNDSDDGKGYILVEDGEIEISATNQALQAAQELTFKGGNLNVTKSKEGLEGKKVKIEGGEIMIVASDDGINATDKSSTMIMRGRFGQGGTADSGIAINILGGDITVNAAGDGLDSNGNIYVSGGKTIVYGPTDNGNAAIDYEGECVITGGTVLAGGASGMTQGFSANSSIYSVEIGLGNNQKVSKVTIETESGEEILTYNSSKSYSSLIVASPSFAKGTSYEIKVDGSNYEDFTITDMVTKVGEIGGGFGRPGGMQNGEGFRGEKPGMKNPPEKPEV